MSNRRWSKRRLSRMILIALAIVATFYVMAFAFAWSVVLRGTSTVHDVDQLPNARASYWAKEGAAARGARFMELVGYINMKLQINHKIFRESEVIQDLGKPDFLIVSGAHRYLYFRYDWNGKKNYFSAFDFDGNDQLVQITSNSVVDGLTDQARQLATVYSLPTTKEK